MYMPAILVENAINGNNEHELFFSVATYEKQELVYNSRSQHPCTSFHFLRKKKVRGELLPTRIGV